MNMDVDSNGVSREGPSTVSDDDVRMEAGGSQSLDLVGLRHVRRRGYSDSEELLSNSARNSFSDEVSKAFRYVAAPVADQDESIRRAGGADENGIGWPQMFESRRRSFAVDLFMIFVAVPFYALAGISIHFDGEIVTELPENMLENCTKVAATLYPIVFSMVVGRSMYKFASWRLERGSSVGKLEQFLNSRTVSSTIATQFKLWPSPFVGLFLVILWVLSPIGSQACLRMLRTNLSTVNSPSDVNYFNTRQPIYSGNGHGSLWPGFATLFSAALVAPPRIKMSSMDSWGNVKIPYLSSLLNFPMSQDGWRNVSAQNFVPDYSSLFGIPLSGLPVGNTTFTIESTYVELSCSTRTTEKVRGENRWESFKNPNLISTNGIFKSANNITELTNWAIGYMGEDITPQLSSTGSKQLPCLDCLVANVNESKFSGMILYQDFSGAQNATSIYCKPSQTYVESRIKCSISDHIKLCAVIAQRESKLPKPPKQVTLLAFPDTVLGLTKFLPNSTHRSFFLDQMQNYLIKPFSNSFIQSTPYPYLDTSSPNQESRLQDIPLRDFATVFGQILNAFLYGGIFNSTQFLTSTSFDEMKDWKKAPSLTAPKSPTDLYVELRAGTPALTATGTTNTTQRIFIVSIPWLIFFLLPTTTIFLSALASAYLSHTTLTPSYLGFVSTLVHESSYITNNTKTCGGEGGGVRLSGLKRTREMMMHGVRVKLGDVGDCEGGYEVGTGVEVRVGKVGVGEEGDVGGLERERLYV